MTLLSALQSDQRVVAAELRPPRAELASSEGMDAWIDTYHAVRRLTRQGHYVFLTDSAVGTREEDNLRHLVTNLGHDVPRERIVPFMTAKHTLAHCLSYAERAHQEGFPSLVVLGGDKAVGVPRCVEHAWQLRQLVHAHVPTLTLGGWANPHADAAQQAAFIAAEDFNADYFLTQVVSHHDIGAVERLLVEAQRRQITQPGVFGVFYYRSANPQTLATLRNFLPVPVSGLTEDFDSGLTPEQVCGRTLKALAAVGVRHVYISNLPVARAQVVLDRILNDAGY